MKAFAIVSMTGGVPDIDPTVTPYYGYCLGAHIPDWGLYLFSGTQAQLLAINALPSVTGICMVTQDGVKWAELDGVIAAGVRTRLNTWLAARGYPTIPVGVTYRRVILEIYKRVNDRFDLGTFDVAGPSD